MAQGVDVISALQYGPGSHVDLRGNTADDILLRQVQSLPKNLHWFCPREGLDDQGLYFEEDLQGKSVDQDHDSSETTTSKVDQAIARQTLIFEALQIFAFDGKDAAQYQEWLEDRLGEQMTRCDVCVREYHRGRRKFKETLNDTYEEDQVRQFLGEFDKMNTTRIERGLDTATKELKQVPTERRRATVLSSAALYAIFETFTCRAMYADEVRLAEHFDEPFNLVQTNKFLRMSAYPPAMTQFLFGQNSDRLWWAERSWEKFKRNITAIEFEWSVREPLVAAMARVQLHALEKDFLPQFWDGVKFIVEKLDKDLITHSLRAIDGAGVEADVCRLALSHLQIDSDGFKSLLATVNQILKVSPSDFWEAMGTISPTTWIDQFFSSPALDRLLQQAREERISDSPLLDALFSWIIPFLSSLKPANQASACRSLVNRLLGSLQGDVYAQVIKTHCFKLGLRVLAETFHSLSYDRSTSTKGAAALEAFEVVEKYINRIAQLGRKESSMVELSSEVIRQVIALDCRCLAANVEQGTVDQLGKHVATTHHSGIWKQAARNIDPGNIVLAKKFLRAIKPLSGVEKFVKKPGQMMLERHAQFNKALDAANLSVCDVLERINNFSPIDIGRMFEDTDAANALVGLILNSDSQVRSTAIEMIKTLSGQSTRREAIDYLLRKYFFNVINALSLAFTSVAVKKAFAPASGMLKLCTDVVDALCDSQDGFLRSATLMVQDVQIMEKFWQALWQALTMIFSTTETWSNVGHDKSQLMEFCRDAMEFADKAFEQFGVITGALDQDTDALSKSSGPSGNRLIEGPKAATGAIVKWLKLRDDFLVSKSCHLVCKLLVRLKEFNTELGEEPLGFIVSIIDNHSRTTLSRQQKAELLRAAETHVGQPVIDTPAEKVERPTKSHKDGVIDLDKWTAKAKTAEPVQQTLKSVISNATPTFEKFRAQQALKHANKQPLKLISTAKSGTSDFLRKRQQEMDEMKRKKALAIAAEKRRVAGEGSGLKGLGVQGKDHTAAPKGSGMMVSSGEESSDDDLETDLDKELFGSSSKGLKNLDGPINLSDEQLRAIKQQRRGPVKKQRLVRSARDMRARLAPDLSPLHKSILGWEYFHEGVFPPNSSAEDYTGVVNSFRDPVDYQRTFQPLLVLEAWNGFLKAREENTSKPYEIKVVNRSSVDAFLEVSSTMAHADAKEVSEGDIVLISKSRSPATAPNEPHCLSRVFRITRKKGHVEILYRIVPGTPLVPSLFPNAVLYGMKITSVIPLEREYGALLGLQYYDLCEEITRAKPSPLLTYNDDRLHPVMGNYGVNKAQAKAVKCAIDNDGFTLVQGPPGSGKTKTIVAIVGALLSDSLQTKGVLISRPQAAPGGSLAKKMLVCAPSNAAVDELVMRFKDGVKTLSGQHQRVNIVRLGRSDAINANVQDVTLEELVNKKLNVNPTDGNARVETQKIMEEHKDVSEKLRDVRARMDEAEGKGGPSKALKEEFDMIRRQKTLLGQKVDSAKDSESTQIRQADINRRKAQQDVINEAHVICATLSGSGHDMFQSLSVEFETVIIDEAAQCVELSALIPLKYGCAKCILVGDPQQLPPTVFSKDAARFKYEQSLFVRMQANHPQDVHLLDTQYRMHPEISAFPSKTFYDSRLLDGQDMAALRSRAWHATTLLSPFRFFDVQGQHESAPRGHSLINRAEIATAIQLYRRLTSDFRDYKFKGNVGVITPYKSQLRELKDVFRQQLGQEISDAIEFNTTDAFQGREAEIIIFSCVRASPAGGIGFLQDIRRMNVGLTRAKCSLWVLGNSQSLMKGEFWAKLVEDAKARDRYTDGDVLTLLKSPLKIVRRVDDGAGMEKQTDEMLPVKQDLQKNNIKTEHRASLANGIKMEKSERQHVPNGNTKDSVPQSKSNGNLMIKQEQRSGPSVPILSSHTAPKRKLSTVMAEDRQLTNSGRDAPQSAVTPSRAVDNGSDIDMPDAPRTAPAKPAAANGMQNKPAVSSNSGTGTNKSSAAPAGGTGAGAAAGVAVKGTGISRPPPPGVLKKKKPVDPFIRKKPRV